MPAQSVRRGFERILEWIVIALMVTLAVEVTAGVVFRYTGYALAWYDEIASVLLAWVTYYGAALAALKRAHIGVPELIAKLAPAKRVPITLFAKACTIAFFVMLAWVGYTVLEVLVDDTLVALPEVSVAWTQSVIPVSSLLFIAAELFTLPDDLAEARRP